MGEREEQEERGKDEDGGGAEDDEDDGEGGVRGGGLVDAQAGRQQVGELGDGPAPDDGDEGGAGERAQRPRTRTEIAAAPQTSEPITSGRPWSSRRSWT